MSNRRKILLVNAVQQRRLIMGSVLLAILLINSLALFTLFLNPQLLEVIEISQTLSLAGLEIIIVAVIGYFSLILSHRVVGPAYAIARDLKRLADGDLTVRTHLRKGDFHDEIAEALNLSSEALCSKIKSIKASLTALQQHEHIDDNTRQALAALQRELTHFKTETSSVAKQVQSEAHNTGIREATVAIGMDNPHSSR
jgi:methyl-accepting chemotaxis protein